MTITLTTEQEDAIKVFSNFLLDPDETYMIIQGAAGCGKSTMIEYLIHSMDAQMAMYALLLKKSKRETEFGVKLTATTNKAADVLNNMSSYGAQTIHSLLRLKVLPDFTDGTVKLKKKKDFCLLFNQLIIIDESSMIDDKLFDILHEATVDCKIVLIGDKYQLAPIKQKESIMDTLQCKYVVEMNKVMRHSGAIQHAGAQYRETVETGIWLDIPESPEVMRVDGATFKQLIDDHYTDPGYTINSAKVIAWTNRMVHAYNTHIRKIKGYPKRFKIGETVFTNKPIMLSRMHWPTDSAIVITNVGSGIVKEGVRGRMVGLADRIEGFLPDDPADVKLLLKRIAKEAKIDPKQWSVYYEYKENWLDLRPAYASTVHKAQGSTYDVVFMDLSDIGKCHISSDVARMLYVGITRAAKQVYLYGDLPSKYLKE